MPWARLGARREIEADWALIAGVWHKQMTLQVAAGGVLASCKPASQKLPHAHGRWVVPPVVRLAEDRDKFARADGKATSQSVRRQFARLLEAGFADVGVTFALGERASGPSLWMQEALLFAYQANRLGMGFSFLGEFDLHHLTKGGAYEVSGSKVGLFDAKRFEDQILNFEAVAGVLSAAKAECPLGWSQWVRLDPFDARSRAALTALRVRFAHLPTILEVRPQAHDQGAEALYELLRLGVLDAQVSLYMPWHVLTLHQATALAARGAQWVLTSGLCESALAQLKKISQQASLSLVIEQEKHPFLAWSQNSPGVPTHRSAQAVTESDLIVSPPAFHLDASHRALGLPKRQLAVDEPLAALSLCGDPQASGGVSLESCGWQPGMKIVSFASPPALLRRLF